MGEIKMRGLTTVAITLASLLFLTPKAGASVINIMPLGDSLTLGEGVGGGYETQLYLDLTGAGQSMLYLGASTANPSVTLYNAGENHQAGYNGAITTYIYNNLDGYDNTDYFATSVGGNDGGYWLTTNSVGNPDFVLLDIGCNDIDFSGAAGASYALSELGLIIDKISLLRPDAHIIVSNLIPRFDLPTTTEGLIVNNFNPYVPGIVAAKDALGEKVSFVDLFDLIDPSTMLSSDNVHPNQLGYNVMGNAWYTAIEQVETTSVPEPASFGIFASVAVLAGSHRRAFRSRGVIK